MTAQQQLFAEKIRPGTAGKSVESPLREMNTEHLALLVEQGRGHHLRRLVLELAVRGRLLVPDLSHSKPRPPAPSAASNAGRRARSRDGILPPVSEEEQPFGIPENWLWGRVNDTGQYINGLAFKPSDWGTKGYPIIRIQNLTDPAKPISRCARSFDDAYIVQTGDLLVSWSATLDVFIWDREPGVLNQHIFRVLPDEQVVQPRYLFHTLRHCIRDMEESEHAHGLVMKHINRGPFLAHPVPIPPLAEQKRIVAKVDQLMGLIDELEAKQTKKREVQTRFRTSALDALTKAEGPEQLAAAWKRVARNFEVLFERGESVSDLRQAVLWAALHGSLTHTEGRHGGLALLNRIRTKRRTTWEKARLEELTANGAQPKGDSWKAKYTPAAEADRNDQLLAGVPSHWEVASLGEIAEVIDPNPSHRYPTYRDGAVPLLSTREFRGRDQWDATGAKVPFVPADVYQEQAARCRFSPRDIIFARKGRLGLARHSPPLREYVFSHTLFVIKTCEEVDADFVLWFLRLDAVVLWLLREMNDNTGVPTLGKGTTERLPVPIPPFAEQKSIVAKVETLMKVCDGLEAKLKAKEETAAKLVEAVVKELVA